MRDIKNYLSTDSLINLHYYNIILKLYHHAVTMLFAVLYSYTNVAEKKTTLIRAHFSKHDTVYTPLLFFVLDLGLCAKHLASFRS